MDAAVQVHPSIKAADQSIDAASKGVDAAKGLYWPTLSATLEASSDKRNAIPARYLRLEQSLWDGGYTAATVSAADAQVRQVDGVVAEVLAQAGDQVEAGAPLIRLEPVDG